LKLKILVELFKVKAHDTDVYNNRVDFLATSAHLNVDNELLDINYQNLETLK
jgi:ribonuclease HI